ncbi:MAG: hydrogenase maturation protease [bacterium]|nr:hydrogenase maturation protease [bacterium]
MTTSASILIIGYGNPHRQDDRAGHLLAERVRDWAAAQGISVTVRTDYQLDLDMVEDIAHATHVFFFDAHTHEFSTAVEVTAVAAEEPQGFTTHAFTPGSLLGLARKLYDAQPDARIISVPGFAFDMRDDMSPTTVAAIDQAFAIACALLHKVISDQ